jgi:23S rRNA (cytidine2498-2'-O)-methyltransferase
MVPSSKRQHLVLMRPGFEEALKDEFADRFGLEGMVVCRAGVAFPENSKIPPVKSAVFARQNLPRALRIQTDDLAAAAKFVTDRIDVMTKRGNRQSGAWTLHAFAIDDDDQLKHAKAIAKIVMQHMRTKQKEFFTRYISPDDFAKAERVSTDILLQIYVPAKDDVWFSIGTLADGVSPWEAGFQRMKTLAGAPSRSASKLEEALLNLGEKPVLGETAVDLGAAPGGWSFVLASHGAHVIAVDHAKLGIKNVSKLKGEIEHLEENGLKYLPSKPVDWMVCDMVMGARDTLKVLKTWLDADAMKHFIVNIKLPKSNPWPQVREALDLIGGYGWALATGQHLLHDRSEITLLGSKFKK